MDQSPAARTLRGFHLLTPPASGFANDSLNVDYFDDVVDVATSGSRDRGSFISAQSRAQSLFNSHQAQSRVYQNHAQTSTSFLAQVQTPLPALLAVDITRSKHTQGLQQRVAIDAKQLENLLSYL